MLVEISLIREEISLYTSFTFVISRKFIIFNEVILKYFKFLI